MQSLESAARWFVGVLVIRTRVASVAEQDELLDFQVRLVRAADPEAAYQSALTLGSAEGSTYRNAVRDGLAGFAPVYMDTANGFARQA